MDRFGTYFCGAGGCISIVLLFTGAVTGVEHGYWFWAAMFGWAGISNCYLVGRLLDQRWKELRDG